MFTPFKLPKLGLIVLASNPPLIVTFPLTNKSPGSLLTFLPVLPIVRSVNTPWPALCSPMFTPFRFPTLGLVVLISREIGLIISCSGCIVTIPPSPSTLLGDKVMVFLFPSAVMFPFNKVVP